LMDKVKAKTQEKRDVIDERDSFLTGLNEILNRHLGISERQLIVFKKDVVKKMK